MFSILIHKKALKEIDGFPAWGQAAYSECN
jgi:hypothetical protein